MKIRFFLQFGFVEWNVPPAMLTNNFSFIGLCKNIRADGHFISEDIFLPAEGIQAIAIVKDNISATYVANAPSTETKR